MANRFLHQIYRSLYNETFDYSNFSCRLKMQKGVYLLQEMGVPIGDYRFSWYKHGPYSQALLDDMYVSHPNTVQFSSDTEDAIERLSIALRVPDGVEYSSKDWAECLGSLQYLMKSMQSSSSDEDILQRLTSRKPHLQDNSANIIALKRIRKLFS